MFQAFLTSITEINSVSNIISVAAAVVIAAILGGIIFTAHKLTSDEFSYEKEFGIVLLVVPVVVALLISVVSTNVARALSIAGVLAIVRYRSTVTKPNNLVFVFFSMAAGFAAGVGMYLAAVIFVVIVCIIAVIYNILTANKGKNEKKTLKIAVPESIDYDGLFNETLDKFAASYKLIAVKIISGGTVTELTYNLKLKDTKDTKAFLDEIRTLNANFKVSLQEFALPKD